MVAQNTADERLYDLLTVRVVEGLDPAEQEELRQLTARHPDVDPDGLERAAAALAIAALPIEPMPAGLRARVEADAAAWFAGRDDAPPTAVVTQFPAAAKPVTAAPKPVTAWGGWLAAAAALVIAVTGWLQVDQLAEDRTALAARQAALESAVARLERELDATESALAAAREASPGQLLAALEAQPGTQVVPWSTTDDPAASGAEGAVFWNDAAQAGLMRFRGLQANDPATAQYQLWIFDAERDDRFPVDGGVFDVPPGVDEILVPIRARLPVGEAVLFAITVEPPGGVVVSSRERIALVAQPGA